ncbi:sulfotransferase, partial [bacterium]|nr:sulfotransferase [bacterium]
IIYILSLSRSGSTFLQSLIGSHGEIVGIGEVGHVLKEYCQEITPPILSENKSNHCSCGVERKECVFWGAVLRKLPLLSKEAGFELVLKHFNNVFPNKVLLDSSKSINILEEYYLPRLGTLKDRGLGLNVKVLFLVRDFRGWVTSIKKHNLRLGRSKIWYTSTLVNSYKWLYVTLRWLRKLKNQDIAFLPICYDNLIFDTEMQMQRIYEFIELPWRNGIKVSYADIHELYGNLNVRSNPRRMDSIVYDNDWMHNWNFSIWSPAYAPVALFNASYARRTAT